MSSFLKKVIHEAGEGLKHTEDQISGFLNPNRRHDDPEEKAADALRASINSSHRFSSFANEREGNVVKWHVDGLDYMYAVSEMIDRARECIFILDWWLSPELYLRRPTAAEGDKWRLDRLLQRKSQEGVKVYVIVYKEVTQTMSMSSKHTKSALEALNQPGMHMIQCMRHPDHIGAKDTVEFWSHHEKVVIVDNHYAAIGGLDLCFGRWDTHTHPLADVHPTDWDKTLFAGQDYNNARVMDFESVGDWVSNQLSVCEYGRMPWHDCHMTFSGPVVLDVVQHFVERWNEIKKRKYRDNQAFDWLAFPHAIGPENATEEEPVARHPHREAWHKMGRRYRQRWHDWVGQGQEQAPEEDDGYYNRPIPATMRVQVVRSVSDWSHGVLTEKSIQDAYIQLINESNHYIYIENQFFISATKPGDVVTNQIAGALANRVIRAAREDKKFKIVIIIPEVPAFSGAIKSSSALKTIMAAQYRTINRGSARTAGASIFELIRSAGYEPTEYIGVYHLRGYDRINAPRGSYLNKIEERSGVTFHEAQVALARLWLGKEGVGGKVSIKIPEESKQGLEGGSLQGEGEDGNGKDKEKKTREEPVLVPETEGEARDIIRRFEQAAKEIRGDENVSDNIAQHMLMDKTGLEDEAWLGTEQEELDAYISELIYIHTKLMIVDDRRVIMGSANLNDRSQKGDGDSEIALVVEDMDMVESSMNGERYMASRFAASLRRQLYKEHLGLIPPQDAASSLNHPTPYMRPAPHPNPDLFGEHARDTEEYRIDQIVADPLADSTISLWTTTARKNREIFTEIFRPVPSNLVRSWDAYDRYIPKTKTGHVVPDMPLSRVKDRLSKVKGALVEAPLDFLIDEKSFVEGPEWAGLNPTLPIYI
ncbi:phospholipase D [Lentinula raphanica]|uniref:Phospholipase n=1 Tax=Lentinula raphanica TaxID=153919 RepID=A0AA38P101_9AGAR|nr:phospholipase D [Lentinula raphanica]KAJ3966772.1 phospholipase D [Lentinula raphanica]